MLQCTYRVPSITVPMNCVYPHCPGTLHRGQTSGFCSLCRLPVRACAHCGAWNRAFAVFCRQCGNKGALSAETDPVNPDTLRAGLRRSPIPQPLTTRPQPASGFLWALGEQGDLFRLNPYAPSGEQVDIYDRFWANPQPHAFSLRPLSSSAAPRPEDTAVLATPDRLLLYGLFSRHRRTFPAAPGETFLVNSRDHFQFAAAHADSLFCLSRHAGQQSFLHLHTGTGEIQRLTLAANDSPLAGPVLLTLHGQAHAIVWSPTSLWAYTDNHLTEIPLPEATELWTSPHEGPLRLAPGRSPAATSAGHLFLVATQYGRPALLRLTPGPHGWTTLTLAIAENGTLSQTTTGQPLLSAPGKLLALTGPAFRTLLQDHQIANRLPAWADPTLTLFFAEADYQGRKQWLKAHLHAAETPISWDLPPGAEVQTCEGFWSMGTSLCSVCVLSDRTLRTEFLSWCP